LGRVGFEFSKTYFNYAKAVKNTISIILKYPFPYKAWFTIANDPDNTTVFNWKELDNFIWKELNLPLANSLFIKSFNHNLRDQVNLVDNPEITSQPHDIIHTWGDYLHSREKGFDRTDAKKGIEILQQHNINPKVWIDHGQSIGNLLHINNSGSTPTIKDQSGNTYKVFEYTLDLIEQIGIRYIWDGNITTAIGQDRPLATLSYFTEISSSKKVAMVKLVLKILFGKTIFKNKKQLKVPENNQYFPHTFHEGISMYCFTRYGTWKDADIYGLSNIISPDKIDSLISTGGTMIVYTHLGKRLADRINESFHIPEETKHALKYVAKQFEENFLMVSSVSELLDYLIIRDKIKVSEDKNAIYFNSDSIRFKNLNSEDLHGKKFSFNIAKFDQDSLTVSIDGKNIDFTIIKESNKIFSVTV